MVRQSAESPKELGRILTCSRVGLQSPGHVMSQSQSLHLGTPGFATDLRWTGESQDSVSPRVQQAALPKWRCLSTRRVRGADAEGRTLWLRTADLIEGKILRRQPQLGDWQMQNRLAPWQGLCQGPPPGLATLERPLVSCGRTPRPVAQYTGTTSLPRLKASKRACRIPLPPLHNFALPLETARRQSQFLRPRHLPDPSRFQKVCRLLPSATASGHAERASRPRVFANPMLIPSNSSNR